MSDTPTARLPCARCRAPTTHEHVVSCVTHAALGDAMRCQAWRCGDCGTVQWGCWYIGVRLTAMLGG